MAKEYKKPVSIRDLKERHPDIPDKILESVKKLIEDFGFSEESAINDARLLGDVSD